MLQLILGRAGYGKSNHIINLLGEKAEAMPSKKVYLIVPRQFTFETDREKLKKLGNRIGNRIEVLSFDRIYESVVRVYGAGSLERLTDSGRQLLMGIAVRQIKSDLKLLQKPAGKKSFVKGALEFYNALKQQNVTPAELWDFSKILPLSAFKSKLQDLSLIALTYEALVANSYLDPLDDLARLCGILNEHAFFKNSIVGFDGFSNFTKSEFLAVEQILKQADEVYATVCSDHLDTKEDDYELFYETAKMGRHLIRLAKKNNISVLPVEKLRTVSRFRAKELKILEKRFLNPESEAFSEPTETIRICSAETIDAEADFIARTICKTVREEGYRYSDFSVIVRNSSNYSNALASAFKKYDIPLFFDNRKPLSHQPFVVLITSALKIPLKGYKSEDIFTFLKAGLAGFSIEEISHLENYCYVWNISSAGMWKKEWTLNPGGFKPEKSESECALLNTINETRSKLLNILIPFEKALQKAKTALEISTVIWNFVEKNRIGKALSEFTDNLFKDGFLDEAGLMPAVFDKVLEIINQMAALFENFPVTPEEYLEYFEFTVSVSELGAIPARLDEVEVGEAGKIRPVSPKIVFIAGANLCEFPLNQTNSGFFNSEELSLLEQADLTLGDPPETGALKELFIAYSAITAPTEKLYVSYKNTSPKGEALAPSVIVDEIKRIFKHCTDLTQENKILSIHTIESQAIAAEVFAKSLKNNDALSATLREYLKSTKYKDRLESIERAAKVSEFKLSENSAKKLYPQNLSLSPSKVEVFYHCPFSFFCRYGVKAEPLRAASLDNLEKGKLVHYILEKTIKECGKEGLIKLNDDELKRIIRQKLELYIQEILGKEEIQASSRKYFLKKLEERLFILLRHIARELSDSEFIPVAFELKIAPDGEIMPNLLNLPDGSTLSVCGVIDRVDIMTKGGKSFVRIVDYKTGQVKFSLADVLHGLNMQMLIYLFTLSGKNSDTFGSLIPAGILYMPSNINSGVVKRDEDADAFIAKTLKMNGLILEDVDVIKGMEKDGKGVHIPARLLKNGTPDSRSQTATEVQFSLINRKIEEHLMHMGERLKKGDISVSPLDGCGKEACVYCDYMPVCGIQNGGVIEKVSNLKNSEVFDILKKGETGLGD